MLLRLLFALLLSAGSLPATSQSFKVMMGQKGTWEWGERNQKNLWKISHVREHARQAQKQYQQALRHLKSPPISSIAKTLHFIWIGPKPFPAKSIAFLKSWQHYHKDWDIYFWTDDPFRETPLEGMQKHLTSEIDSSKFTPIIESSTNWGEKADIFRYLILEQLGGVYADHDIECLRSFNPLVEQYDFVAGYAPLHDYPFTLNSPFVPNNGLIMARAHHPIIQKTLERLFSRWDSLTEASASTSPKQTCWRVIARTFDPFAYCASKYIKNSSSRNIIMPACYFHSGNCFNKHVLKNLSKKGLVYAIHHFHTTWAPAPS